MQTSIPILTRSAPPRPSRRAQSLTETLANVIACSSGPLREHARSDFERSGAGQILPASAPAGEERAWVQASSAAARAVPLFRLERFLQRVVAEEMGALSVSAAEEKRAEIEALRATERAMPAESDLLEADPLPPYLAEIDFHLIPGAQDGHDLSGEIPIGPAVFRAGGIAAVPLGSNLRAQRLEALRQLPRDDYGTILEIGCGGAHTLATIHHVFPDAALVGIDVSAGAVRSGRRIAQRTGLEATILQRHAEDTGFPDDSFDAVISYAVHHEMPVATSRLVFAEMFRLLRPGGDILIVDPAPFHAVTPFHAALLNWETENRNEPYFTEAGLADWKAELATFGFAQTAAYAIGPECYPWVTRGTKPGNPRNDA